MSSRLRSLAAVIAGATLGGFAQGAAAQGWTADLYGGGTRYDALASRVGASNLVGNLRYQGGGGLFSYLSAAAPLDAGATPWAAAGLGLRRERGRTGRLGYGIDLAAHGYGFRDELSDSAASATGAGASLHVLPFVALRHDAGRVELYGGRHQHGSRSYGESATSGIYEVGGRASLVRGPWLLTGEARWLRDDTAAYRWAGAQLATTLGRARVWASGGKWLADALDQVGWGVGASVAVGAFGEVWSSIANEPTDPLYGNVERVSWNVGLSRPLGRRTAASVVAPAVSDGRVAITLRGGEVPGAAAADEAPGQVPGEVPGAVAAGAVAAGAAPSVAGEFSGWKPTPMRRAGDDWVLELPLGSGVHRFAFVAPDGSWFVPEDYPGRMDDGMGGHVAVLVVP